MIFGFDVLTLSNITSTILIKRYAYFLSSIIPDNYSDVALYFFQFYVNIKLQIIIHRLMEHINFIDDGELQNIIVRYENGVSL